jgi:regulator of sigma E protease
MISFLSNSLFPILAAILAIAFLMVVHETGHFLLARFFGMRVKTFSIGFGPALWRKQPKGSPTTYQVAIVPFLAYVQIAGMNPLEEIDPDDKQSYANARLHARILTIFAGPLANYLVASVLFFLSFWVGGQTVLTTSVTIVPGSAAAQAGMLDGDKVTHVGGSPIRDWDGLRAAISSRPGQKTEVLVERKGQPVRLEVLPRAEGKEGHGRIGVQSQLATVPVPVGTAVALSLERPPEIVAGLVVGLVRWARGLEKPDLSGPVGIVKETAKAVKSGFATTMYLLGALSAYLAGFNLLPIPALDGGRLMFLAYEATTRRRPNAKIEAHVHAVGLLMLLAVIAVVTVLVDIPRPGP